MLLTDSQIIDLCYNQRDNPMISPFDAGQITKIDYEAADGTILEQVKAISSGTSSVGYDIKIGPTIKYFRKNLQQAGAPAQVIDPKNFDPNLLTTVTVPTLRAPNNYFIIPEHGYCLANTPDYFRMPEDVAAICLTKSTYARCGLLVNVTPLEPGWHGHLTLELANLTDLPMKVYVNEGIAQLLFFRLSQRPAITYADRGGKYLGQGAEPVLPKML